MLDSTERLIFWLLIYAILWHTGLLHVIVVFITAFLSLILISFASILDSLGV